MRYLWLTLSFVCVSVQLFATVCLNMIVKDEKDVICRCLESVLPVIDTWVIVDTGSTDGTQEIIKNFMKEKGVPGELHERPWKNFGHNRNEALELAKGKADYIFFIDADEYLEYEPDFTLPKLDKDFYYVMIHHASTRYCRTLFVKDSLNWRWIGVLHEYIGCEEAKTHEILPRVANIYTTEGARSKDPQKYLKDAAILEQGLVDEPNNERYRFYLAQSYQDAGNYEKALEHYEKRIAMGGWDQEVFWAKMRVADLKERLGHPKAEVIEAYLDAYNFRKSRIEPLYHLAHLYREQGDFKSAYEIAAIAKTVPETKDVLFVQKWMKDYGIDLERSIAAYWLEKYRECQAICLRILQQKELPENIRQCVENNLGFANGKLLENAVRRAKDE